MLQLDLSDLPPAISQVEDLSPGALFRTSHGTFYLLLCIKGDRADCLHYDVMGGIIGSKTFGATYLEKLQFVGRCDIKLNVDWRV